MSDVVTPSLDTYRSGNAQVNFSPEQFEVLGERVAFVLEAADSISKLAAAATAFTASVEKLNGQLPNIFPAHHSQIGYDLFPPDISTEPEKFNMIHLESIKQGVEEAKRLGIKDGAITVYSLSEFAPDASSIEADIKIPRQRATHSLSLDTLSVLETKAVIGGVSDKRTDGRSCPCIQFAAVIDYTKPSQKVKAYYGADYEEGNEIEPLFDAVIATLPQPSE